jgi:hypothetical protein
MAEILVFARDSTHPDPKKDKNIMYKRGDPIVAKSDGHKWGKMECLPDFVVLKIPDIHVKDVESYCHTKYQGMEIILRREYKIDLDDLLLDTKIKSKNLQNIFRKK